MGKGTSMTKVVFHINMNGVTLHINGAWESKHFSRTHVDKIGEDLAKEKGIRHGDRVKVRSNRGEVVAACVVTKRMKGLDVDGKKVHHVGIPIHWGKR